MAGTPAGHEPPLVPVPVRRRLCATVRGTATGTDRTPGRAEPPLGVASLIDAGLSFFLVPIVLALIALALIVLLVAAREARALRHLGGTRGDRWVLCLLLAKGEPGYLTGSHWSQAPQGP